MDFLARSLSHLLVPMFFIGIVGSLAVVAVTIVQDFHEIFTADEAIPGPDQTTH